MIPVRLTRLVRRRAGYRCEYCGVHEDQDAYFAFHIEHVVAEQHGGTADADNLALAGQHDNLHKGPNLAGIDPRTGKLTRLFNPRRQRWNRHFRFVRAVIIGRTAVGRTTVGVLALNAPDRVALREALLEAGELAEPSRGP